MPRRQQVEARSAAASGRLTNCGAPAAPPAARDLDLRATRAPARQADNGPRGCGRRTAALAASATDTPRLLRTTGAPVRHGRRLPSPAWPLPPPVRPACGAACTNLNTDGKNCGSCGKVCASGTSCLFGACLNPTSLACTPSAKANASSVNAASITLGKYWLNNNEWGASTGSGTQ